MHLRTEIWGQMRHWWYFNETKSLLFAYAGWHLGIVHAVDIEEWSPPGVSLLFWKLTDLLFGHVHNNTKHIFDVCTAHGSVLVALSQVVGVIFMTVKMCLHAMFCWHPCNLCSCCQHCTGCFPKPCCQHCPNIAISSVPFSSQYNQLLTFQYFIQSTLLKKPFRESFVLDWVKMPTNINQIPIKTQKMQKMPFPPFIWANIRNLTCYGVPLSESKAAQMGLLERLNSSSSKGCWSLERRGGDLSLYDRW